MDLAKLGAEVLAIGALGQDLIGDVVTAAMARHGVDTSGLARKPGVQTSATILPIRGNGERPALHVPGATPLLELADIDLDRVRASRALLVGAPDALGPLAADGLAEVVAAARASGALVVTDVLYPGRPRTWPGSAGCWPRRTGSCPTPTSSWPSPAARLSPRMLAAAIADILALGAGGVAVTLGAEGCLVAWRGGGPPVALPALPVEVVDTTGCGDGFTAGMLAGLLLGAARPTRPGWASPAARWSPPAWARTPGSRAWARSWPSCGAPSPRWRLADLAGPAAAEMSHTEISGGRAHD